MRGRAGRISMLAGVVAMTVLAGCSSSGGVRAISARPAASSLPTGTVHHAALPFDDAASVTTLANGLTTIVRENDRPGGEVELRLVIDAGSTLQDEDQAGVAHFLEHMMFNGTAKYPKNELTAALQHLGASFGADINAATSYDDTVYQLTVPNDPEAVDTAVDILHEWLTAATLQADDVTAERGVVLDEWRQSTESADGRAFDAFADALFAGTAYADRDPIGTDAAIEAMTPELLRRFYDRWYRPENATVIVVGDIDESAMVDQLADVFGDAVSRDAAPFDRPVVDWQPPGTAVPVVHSDADLSSAFVEVVLVEPDDRAAAQRPMSAADVRDQTFDALIATLITNRLDDARRGGSTVVTGVGAETASPVRATSWTGVYVSPSAGATTDALQAVLDEVQRAASSGFGDAEVERAVAATRSAVEDAHAAAATAVDAELIESYVDHVLTGAVASDPDVLAAAAEDALDAATPAALSAELAARWSDERPYVLVAAPDGAAGVPSVADVEQMLDAAAATDSPASPSPDDTSGPDVLMERPAPVEEASSTELDGDGYLIQPTVLHFANGMDVVLAPNDIVDGEVTVAGTRDGGMSILDDAQIPAARFAPWAVAASGLGELDAVDLGHVLSATGIDLSPQIWQESASIQGTTPTDDLETAMAYLHLLLDEARVDDSAMTAQLASAREAVASAGADPDFAAYEASNLARYGDTPRYRTLLTDAELDGVTVDGVEAVWQRVVGGAAGWRVAFAGDFDVVEATDLARSYFGTLVAGEAPGHFVDRMPAFPEGATRQEVRAGTGDKASLIRLVELDVDDLARAEVLADLLSSVLDTRLTDTIREALGASYSPTAYAYVMPTPRPTLMVEVDVTGAPDDMARLHDVLERELADLATNGPTARESDDAFAAEEHDLQYVDNVSVANALADMAVRPGVLDAYITSLDTLADLDRDDLAELAAALFGSGRYIEVTTLPKA